MHIFKSQNGITVFHTYYLIVYIRWWQLYLNRVFYCVRYKLNETNYQQLIWNYIFIDFVKNILCKLKYQLYQFSQKHLYNQVYSYIIQNKTLIYYL